MNKRQTSTMETSKIIKILSIPIFLSVDEFRSCQKQQTNAMRTTSAIKSQDPDSPSP